MTPVAAYYVFIANEQARAAAETYRVSRPSLIDRLRGRVVTLREKSPAPHQSPVARTA